MGTQWAWYPFFCTRSFLPLYWVSFGTAGSLVYPCIRSLLTLLGLQGRPLELDDVLDLVEERYLYDPDDPYDERSSSSDDQVADHVDLTDLPAAFAR